MDKHESHGTRWYCALLCMTLLCVSCLCILEDLIYVWLRTMGYVMYYDLDGCPKTFVEPYVVIDFGSVMYVLCALAF